MQDEGKGADAAMSMDADAQKIYIEDKKIQFEYDKLSNDTMQAMLALDEQIRNNREKEKNEKLKIAAMKQQKATASKAK
jgi:hypothetical protein